MTTKTVKASPESDVLSDLSEGPESTQRRDAMDRLAGLLPAEELEDALKGLSRARPRLRAKRGTRWSVRLTSVAGASWRMALATNRVLEAETARTQPPATIARSAMDRKGPIFVLTDHAEEATASTRS
jgi:hypothetical protein